MAVAPSLPNQVRKNGRPINIVRDYAWSVTPPNKRRWDIPYIELEERYLNLSQILNSMAYWAHALTGNGENPYAHLYSSEPTGYIYKFPYFSEYNHQVGNSWDCNDFEVPGYGMVPHGVRASTGRIMGELGKVVKAISPSTQFIRPKVWTGTSEADYDFEFHLLNTINFGTTCDNYELCEQLIYQNLSTKRNPVISDPPVIYTVRIPGIRHSPAAVISDLQISNIGMQRLVKLFPDRDMIVVPEAYRVRIKIQELIAESRNIYNGAIGKDVVQATQDAATLIDRIKNTPAGELFNNGMENIGNVMADNQQSDSFITGN